MKYRIQKVSNVVLWIILSITFVVAILFYGGGEVPETQRMVYDLIQPSFTDLLIDWVLILTVLLIVVTFSVDLCEKIRNIGNGTKGAILLLTIFIALLLLMFASWLLGDGTTFKISGYEGKDNVPFWMKTADMWFYSIGTLVIIATLLIVGFSLRKKIVDRKGH